MECHYAETSNKGNLSLETVIWFVSVSWWMVVMARDYIHEHWHTRGLTQAEESQDAHHTQH